MGLDMFAYTTTKKPLRLSISSQTSRIVSFTTGASIRTCSSDLDWLEADIRTDQLPATCGFFFGQSDGSEIDDDLAFVAKARSALARGLTAYYTSWW
jgi:hypothetical protein